MRLDFLSSLYDKAEKDAKCLQVDRQTLLSVRF